MAAATADQDGAGNAAAIVLLAAGEARRFGGPKQLLLWQGVPLVRFMAEKALASRAGRVIAVLGAHRDEVAAALEGLPVELAENPEYAAGQSSSVRRGVEAAEGAGAILFLPADMPLLSVATLDRLLGVWLDAPPGAPPAAVAPLYAGSRGAPVLFDRRLFAELARLEGDRGGRALLPGLGAAVAEVAVGEEAEGLDLDLPEDLREARKKAAAML